MPFSDLDMLCVNTIRTLSIDAVEKAKSGHPGLPLGAAPMAYVLWDRHLKHDPRNPKWPDRDRFVLSAGHGSMLQYSLLHLSGYDVSMEDLKAFRQWGSRTPGHPESFMTPGVEATTGPLGQGAANAVGMAMAERALAAHFNRPGHAIVDHFTYALVSDGDLMEGVSAEACSLAGHLKLGRLIYLYDANDVTLDGPTSMTFSVEDVGRRYEAYGWQVLHVADGDHDLAAIDRAIRAAKADTGRPSLIILKTTIGYGSPNKHGKSSVHGSPLGEEELKLTKKALGWDPEKHFQVPDQARERLSVAVSRGRAVREEWEKRFASYEAAFPDLAREWKLAQAGQLPEGWDRALPAWKTGEKLATRQASGTVLNAIAARVPWFLGGDADLGCSTNTIIKDGGSFDGQSGKGRNIHFGVREHAMAAIANGMLYHGGLRPFVATFFCFADYMRPSVRLAAMNSLPAVYVWTHDSIGLGEDGPTHQPVEHLMSLRVIPNMTVIRPCDAHETTGAWVAALRSKDRPVGLVLTRQAVPTLAETGADPAGNVARGAYVLAESTGGAPELILIATGSEVSLALEARKRIEGQGKRVRVVSMPSWDLFAAQDPAYRESVLPRRVTARVAVEAGSPLGWEKWVGDQGAVVGVDRFGASAPAPKLYEGYGLTVERITEAALGVAGGFQS